MSIGFMVAFKDGRRVSVVASKCECECKWLGWDDEEWDGEWRRVGTVAAVVVSNDGAGCEGEVGGEGRGERGEGGIEKRKDWRRKRMKIGGTVGYVERVA